MDWICMWRKLLENIDLQKEKQHFFFDVNY